MPLSVQLTASRKRGECKAVGKGTVKHIVTPAEAASFGLTKSERMKEAIGKIVGQRPDDYWLHDPTPEGASNGAKPEYGAIYKLFDWRPVTTTLTVKSARFLEITTQPVIASHVEWINNENHPVHYSASMTVTKAETVGNSWSSAHKVSVGQKISYKVGVKDVAEVGGETSFGYEHTWGQTKTESKTVTVGVSSSADSNVPAHSAETAYLFSNLGSAKFRVTYEATLSGSLAFQHTEWYDGHRYRALSPDAVLTQAGLPTSITVTEDLTVGFYTDAVVEVASGRYNPKKKPGR